MKPRVQISGNAVPRFKLWLALAALLLALGAALWSWRQYAQPGSALYRQGLADMAAGQTAQAERDWLQGAREDPEAPQCFIQLGDLYMQQQRFREAVLPYQTAVKFRPGDGDLFLRLNRALVASGDPKAGLAAARRATQLRPDDPDAFGLYGLLAVKEDDKAAALFALARAVTLRPNDPDYLLPLVRLKIAQVDLAGAERDLTPYARLRPNNPEACFLMATLINQKPHTPENIRAALDYARRAQAGRPDNPRILSLLGEIDLSANRPVDALKAYEAGLRQEPHSEAVLHGLVTCYTRLGNSQKAARIAAELQAVSTRHQRIDHLKDLLRLKRLDTTAGLELARLEHEDGSDGLAEYYYRRMARQAPRDPRTRPALAAFYRRAGRPDLARQALRPDFVP